MTQQSPSSSPRTPYILGVDIGAQSTGVKLFELKNGEASGEGIPLQSAQGEPMPPTATAKGANNLTLQIKTLIELAYEQAQSLGGELIAAGMGMPGRFDSEHRIKEGTARNIEPADDDVSQQFDGKSPAELFAQALKNGPAASVALTVRNDADAMMTAIIHEAQKPMYQQYTEHGKPCIAGEDGCIFRPDHLLKQTALLSLGSGVGHCIVRPAIDARTRKQTRRNNGEAVEDNSLQFVTDGHASKLLISIDAEDLDFLKAAEAYAKQNLQEKIHIRDDNTAIAEHLFSDTAIKAMAHVTNGKEIDVGNNKQHERALALAGKYMGRTIAAIASAENQDVNPKQGWSEEDKKIASQTVNYILAGGVGSSEDGVTVMQAARKELNALRDVAHQSGRSDFAQRLDHIRLYRYVGKDLTEKAAASMAAQELTSKQDISR